MRAADAVEAIAVEIFRQCECSGQPVTMRVIDRALEQLRGPSGVVPMWALRGCGEGESRPCLSRRHDVAAVGGRDTRLREAIKTNPCPRPRLSGIW